MCSKGRGNRAAPHLLAWKALIAMQTEKQSDLDRRNDRALLTPLLLMALVLVLGILVYVYTGHALAAAI
jgi:hypothetical protein